MPTPRASTPRYFRSAAEWRTWLAANHETATEIVVGYHKVGTGKPTLTWPESVDEALCYGWIDGVRKRVDDERYCIRFSPRRPTSIWSAVNIRRFGELDREGRVHETGRAAFARRKENRSGVYAYEQRKDTWDEPYRSIFARHRAAFRFFLAQPAGYRKIVIWWVVSAKREVTREKRLAQLIADSANGQRLQQLDQFAGGKKKVER